MRIAVVGGTGAAGRRVVEEVTRTGHEPVVLSRATGVDLLSGAGLDAAPAGAEAVVDVSNPPDWRRPDGLERFFTEGTWHLLEASARTGARHLVVLSIVGSDVVDPDYYAGKRRQEALVAAGPVPWTVLRATQFFEFAAQVLAGATGPVALVPPMLSQPVSTADVAARLVESAVGAPHGLADPAAGRGPGGQVPGRGAPHDARRSAHRPPDRERRPGLRRGDRRDHSFRLRGHRPQRTGQSGGRRRDAGQAVPPTGCSATGWRVSGPHPTGARPVGGVGTRKPHRRSAPRPPPARTGSGRVRLDQLQPIRHAEPLRVGALGVRSADRLVQDFDERSGRPGCGDGVIRVRECAEGASIHDQ
ncbi:NAD(P)H-binding protein [Actinosynnema sp. NPDC051121]|nr:NAD(P)H-binding protein [Saccharothrix sp.]